MKKFGYFQIAAREQKGHFEQERRKQLNVDAVFFDNKQDNRPKLFELINTIINKGDQIIVQDIKDIAIDANDLVSIVSLIAAKGATFISKNDGIDTSGRDGPSIIELFKRMAAMKDPGIKTKASINKTIENQKSRGRKTIIIDELQFEEDYYRYLNDELTHQQFSQKHGLSTSTLFRRIKALEDRLGIPVNQRVCKRAAKAS